MKRKIFSVLLISSALAACGGSDNKSSSSSVSSSTTSSLSSSSVSETPSSSSSSVESSSESSASSSAPVTAWTCPATGLYFCDDFADNNTDKWDLLPTTSNSLTPTGAWDVADDNGNYVLRYTANDVGGILALVKPSAFTGVTTADYYVEAKIRPRANSTTSNKQLYILARYQDGNNWYGGALNVQNATTSTQVEITKMLDGNLSRPKQVKKPIVQGTKDMLDGQWYSLRLELLDSTLTVYLDGETIATHEDTSFTTTGLIGFWTANKSFEVDDIKVGDASEKPASLLVVPADTSYAAEVGDAPRVIAVAAKTDTGEADAFTVISSNPEVVSVSVDGTSATLTPVGVGSATITFSSASELTRIISADIAPQFVMPTATYDLAGITVPAVGEANAYEDLTLKLTFDSAPTLGTAGSIRIFKTSDDALVDVIKMVDESDAIGFGVLRNINTRPVRISGNTASISLHANVLEPNTSYYVAISESALTGATLAGQPFNGIGKNANWSFTTRVAKPASGLTSINVDDDGSTAHFRSLQGALNYVMENSTTDAPVTINVKNGVYEEPLYLRNKNNLTVQGEDRDSTIIQYTNNELLNSGSSGRALFLVENADMLVLDNITLKNTTLIANGGQAETIYFNSPNGRLIATNANFISEQDTLLLKGWTWFYNTLVAGNVDFIWGYSKASLFEKSEIRTLGDSRGNGNGGYVLQARVESATDKGFVFLNSSVTRGAGPLGDLVSDGATYLARSPGGTTTYDNIVFINTRMDNHIAIGGWAGEGVNNQPAANPSTGTATTGWREYGTMNLAGDTQDLGGRQFGYVMNLAEVMDGYCSREQIFAAYNNGAGWDPLPSDTSDCVDVDGTGASSSSAGSNSSSSAVSSLSDSSSSPGASSASSSADADSSSSTSSGASSSVGSGAVVVSMNFQSLGSTGLAENTETTLTTAVDAPVVSNTQSYAVQLIGKLKINTTQAPPSGATASDGVIQFANNTSSPGKILLNQVHCPFTLNVSHAPSSTGDATRKLRITVDGSEVYFEGDGDFQMATVTPTCSGMVDVEVYGWDGTLGKGVRIFDLAITQ